MHISSYLYWSQMGITVAKSTHPRSDGAGFVSRPCWTFRRPFQSFGQADRSGSAPTCSAGRGRLSNPTSPVVALPWAPKAGASRHTLRVSPRRYRFGEESLPRNIALARDQAEVDDLLLSTPPRYPMLSGEVLERAGTGRAVQHHAIQQEHGWQAGAHGSLCVSPARILDRAEIERRMT